MRLNNLLLLSVLFIFSACTKNKAKEGMSHNESVKFEQYLVSGQQLYIQHCSACHQPEGQGLAKLYPPLANSDFMKENFEQTLCLMKNGITGEIIVNGVSYNQPMPGISTLTDLEIAEIATYIYNSWGNNAGLIKVDTVKQIIPGCK